MVRYEQAGLPLGIVEQYEQALWRIHICVWGPGTPLHPDTAYNVPRSHQSTSAETHHQHKYIHLASFTMDCTWHFNKKEHAYEWY